MLIHWPITTSLSLSSLSPPTQHIHTSLFFLIFMLWCLMFSYYWFTCVCLCVCVLMQELFIQIFAHFFFLLKHNHCLWPLIILHIIWLIYYYSDLERLWQRKITSHTPDNFGTLNLSFKPLLTHCGWTLGAAPVFEKHWLYIIEKVNENH